MEKKMEYVGWVSWVCNPHSEPYCVCILFDTKEKAEATFCEANGKRSRMFADCKIVHQKVTIKMPPEVCAEFDKWNKEIGGGR